MEHLALDILVKNNAGIIEYTRQQMNLQRALMRY